MSEFSQFLQEAQIESYTDKLKQALGSDAIVALQGLTTLLRLQSQLETASNAGMKTIIQKGIAGAEISILQGMNVAGFGITYTYENSQGVRNVQTMWIGDPNAQNKRAVDLNPYVILREKT